MIPDFRIQPALLTSLFTAVFVSASASSYASVGQVAGNRPLDLADPFVGTSGHGHAFPGATTPFGMVQLSPDTRVDTWDGCSGYHYSDGVILGFSHTHLAGTGCGCLGDIMLMPTVGDVQLEPGTPGHGYASRFSHRQESAHPGYYSVFLQDPKVKAEMTVSPRTGYHRYTFPNTNHAHIVLDLLHGIMNDAQETYLKVEDSTTISGYRKSNGWGGERTVFFVAKLSKPCASFGIQEGGNMLPAGVREAKGKVRAHFDFSTATGEAIEVRVGISATGLEGARENLESESPIWNFALVRSKAEKQWSDLLGRIKVNSKDRSILRTFYSNAYLTYLAPNLFNDVDGSYVGLDHKVHPKAKFDNYSTFSLWDTYRALNPLLTITQPERVPDMAQSMLAEYRESGLGTTPIWPLWGNETWCMIGYHSVSVLADAYFKGLLGSQAEAYYQAMKASAMRKSTDLDFYRSLGYVASRSGEAATSKTIEFGVDDWSIAKMAEALGHTEDAKLFYRRAANYRNLFDRTTRFFRGRKADGRWRAPFDTRGLVGDEYTEADAWQYAFTVQHDVPGMISLYGGDQKFVARMDEMFHSDTRINTSIPDITGRLGQYAQGNEQCHHQAYLYDYAGAPWKSQYWLRKIMRDFYTDAPDGQIGNTDCGQMAAWYTFSALGFYPVNPTSGVYAIGSPVVDSAQVHLPSGHSFYVIAENNSPKNIYIQSATLNGKPYRNCWIDYKQLSKGGTLVFAMGPKPNPRWGAAPECRPQPTMPAGFHYAALPTPSSDKPVVLALPIRVICGEDEAVGNFVPDPNMVEGSTSHADVTVDTSVEHAAPAKVYASERYGDNFAYRFPVAKGRAYHVRLHFAEIFDNGKGMRVENISINGRPVLKNFDPFVEAGGMNKAVVREFVGIKPDAKGQIEIRIQAAPGSPDQNAKISAIEIW